MFVAALAVMAHCLFGSLVALLIVILRESITGRYVPKLYALFGLLPLVGWPLAALWPAPAFRYDPRQGWTENR